MISALCSGVIFSGLIMRSFFFLSLSSGSYNYGDAKSEIDAACLRSWDPCLISLGEDTLVGDPCFIMYDLLSTLSLASCIA